MIVLVVDGQVSIKMKRSESDFKIMTIENEEQAVGLNILHLLQIEKRDSHRFVQRVLDRIDSRFGRDFMNVFVDPNWIPIKEPAR